MRFWASLGHTAAPPPTDCCIPRQSAPQTESPTQSLRVHPMPRVRRVLSEAVDSRCIFVLVHSPSANPDTIRWGWALLSSAPDTIDSY